MEDQKLNTIQKRENLNTVTRLGDKGNGGAYHEYLISYTDKNGELYNVGHVRYQKGPRHEEKSVHGVTDQDLLEIVRDRLTCFANGDMPTYETIKALEHVELALMYLHRRTEDRIERNVLGTNKE